MTLSGLICVVLLADLFVDDEHRMLTFWMTIVSLLITMWVLLATAPLGRIVLFDGSYVSDPLSQILKVAAVGFVAIAFLYARDYLRANDLHKGEYYILGLLGLLGMMIIGMTLGRVAIREIDLRFMAGCVAIRYLLWPWLMLAVVLLLQMLMTLPDELALALLLLGVVPMAANVVVVAMELGIKPAKGARAVRATTLAAPLLTPP